MVYNKDIGLYDYLFFKQQAVQRFHHYVFLSQEHYEELFVVFPPKICSYNHKKSLFLNWLIWEIQMRTFTGKGWEGDKES